MTLRPEFERLEAQSHELFWSKEKDLDFLNKAEDHIRLCEQIAETDIEWIAIEKARYWLKRRLSELVNPNVETKLLPPSSLPSAVNDLFVPHSYDFTEQDHEFLRSFHTTLDKPSGNNDDGA